MKRTYGSGHLYVKSGAYYVRWRTPDGRHLNRRVGKVRTRGERDGLTRAEAERAARRLVELDTARPAPPTPEEPPPTVDEVVDEMRDRIAIEGARLSYRQNCAAMQRVHVSPAIGTRRVESVTRQGIERLARAMLARGASPKTVRNVMTFLHSVFALAMKNGWTTVNPVTDAARPNWRRASDADPDLQFLTMAELDAVIATIPDVVVDRDVFGPVLRVIILTAGTTGLRQSELLGLRWKDIDMSVQRLRVRNAWGARGALRRGQVGPQHSPVGADVGPARPRAEEVAAADRVRR
ncbi:MAG TPA: hypothetical protein VGM80_05725 [Gaiellaceae bacterium]|jgi:integrase